MAASYLTLGSLVSVSLSALKNKHSIGFPLCSITDECGKLFCVDLANETTKEVGNYFVLAIIFPSCKVLKNEVRLSSNLSCTRWFSLLWQHCVLFTLYKVNFKMML